MPFDFAVVGGGIIGLSTAWQLQRRYPERKILLMEKEDGLGWHQTGHNSGVIHSGIYYQPGSLKARFCRQGLVETIGFCKTHGIRYHRCGKLLVAVNPLELGRMEALYQRGRQNGVNCEILDREALADLEPNVRGLGAIYTGETAIVDYREVCAAMARDFQTRGGRIELNREVAAIRENDTGILVQTRQGDVDTRFLVCCAGLTADRLALKHGIDIDFRIIPFRGEYYRLPDPLSGIVSRLIYPIPDPALPFLGIHLTKTIDGTVTVGPNAVLGFKREGYGGLNFSLEDTAGMFGFSGFWRLLRSHFGSGVRELRNSLSKRAFLAEVRRYCPSITLHDLHPHPAGIRAQAVLKDGTLVHDFLFKETPRSLHVCNAPSPAATSAIPIGSYISDKIAATIS